MNLATHHEFSMSKLRQTYDLSDETVIGRGGNGSVSICTRRGTTQRYALKTITTGELTPQVRAELLNEMGMQRSLDHPNIVRVYESFEDIEAGQVHIVMELCTGGCLLSRLGERLAAHGHTHGFGEASCAALVEEMLSAVLYCHQHGVVHRDIKLDNFMFRDETDSSALTLIDFGYACAVQRGAETMRFNCGTPSYMAPELLGHAASGYDSSVDVWALGVVVFMLLSGTRPWYAADLKERGRMIREEPLLFEGARWEHVSCAAKDFISCLLQKEPGRRLSARDALSHEWLQQSRLHGADSVQETSEHAEIVQALQAFSQADELQKVALEVIAFATPAAQLEELRRVFVAMDEDSSGTISITEFRKALSSNPEIPHEQVLAVFEHIDINHTGEIDYSEFLAATLSSQRAMDAPSVGVAFGLLDRDGDGYLTKADLMHTLATASGGYTEEEVDELLRSARTRAMTRSSHVAATRFAPLKQIWPALAPLTLSPEAKLALYNQSHGP